MPNVNDIVTLAQALEKCPIKVSKDRCVAVRNRKASCRNCVRACPVDAIEVYGNELTVDASACMACGACTAVCPTGALSPIGPTDAELAQSAAEALPKAENCAVFACARIASKHLADPEAYSEVPCLARIDESIILSMAANGAERILLVDGNCSTCKYHEAGDCAGKVIESARKLIMSMGADVPVEQQTGFPEGLLIENAHGRFGSTRRGFFTDAFSTAKGTAVTAAKTAVAQEFGYDFDEIEIGKRLHVTEDGTLPLISVTRHEVIMNALDTIGEPCVEEIDSELFGSIEVKAYKCNGCGMCVTFCPTGALSRCPGDEPKGTLKRVEFSACDCINCKLCVDVCWKRALKVKDGVKAAELFDFEPVLYEL